MGTEDLDPTRADKPVVVLDNLGDIPKVLLGNLAVVVCKHASATRSQPKLRSVLDWSLDGNMNVNGLVIFTHPEKEDIGTIDKDLGHQAILFSA